MLSGKLAGETIVDALEKDEPTQELLWNYSCKYMEIYGVKQAALDIFRRFLISSTDDDLNYGMNCRLLTEEDVLKAGLGEDFRLNITQTATRVFRGLKNVRFLNKLRQTVSFMRQVKAHYKDYPEAPENFQKWKAKTEKLFKEVDSKMGS